jgi:uncharacterized protein YciI
MAQVTGIVGIFGTATAPAVSSAALAGRAWVIALCLLAGMALAGSAVAGEPRAPQATEAVSAPPAPPPQQWLYRLRVQPAFFDSAAWTAEANAAVSKHFERLRQATAEGRVLLAGRTMEPLDQTFGIVVFEAPDEASARKFMEEDPAVVAGVMSATLHPYRVALMRSASP